MIRENNQAGNFTHTWTYDNAGNILERKEYAYTTGELGTPTDTVAYAYGDASWGDLLTSYGGKTITRDTIGNPLNDGTWTYTWRHGRQLASMSNGTTTWNFTYNADGLRTKRTNGTTTYHYVYNGDKLSQMTVGSNLLQFSYDAAGTPMAVLYNGTTYYYATNLQGDVIAILDATGAAVVEYTYDAWGNPISTTGSMAATLGTVNPLRYRGYVYDAEYGFYYLQSRYYNPEVGRFLNADALAATGQGLIGNNMFAYCCNNPTNMNDVGGDLPKWLSGALDVVSGALQMVVGAVVGATVGWSGIGAVAGGILIANGAATATKGVGKTVNSITGKPTMREDNIIKTGVQSVGNVVGGAKGKAIAGGIYDGVIVGASLYAGAVAAAQEISRNMPRILESKLFTQNNGYGIKIGEHLEMFYRNPNAAGGLGGTIFSYNGPLGKLRLDWDPTHYFHFHPPGHK